MLEFGRWDARAGLDKAAAPRRPAQRQHAPAARAWGPTPASTRSATFRRRARSVATSTRSTRRTSCRGWCSTISTRRTTTPSPRWPAISRTASVAGKMQFGSGWWFLDQKEAMEWQLNALANIGLLSRFVGMLTDSRNFLCYPRHEYFRRVLCNLLGRQMERGELPSDVALVGAMVRRICFANARDYFGLELRSRLSPGRPQAKALAIRSTAQAGGRTGLPLPVDKGVHASCRSPGAPRPGAPRSRGGSAAAGRSLERCQISSVSS